MRVDNILAGPTPENGKPETTSTAQMDRQASDPMAIYKRKLTTITHREIIRKAEALMVKPPAIATPKPAARTLGSIVELGKPPAVAVVVPSQSPAKEIISVPNSPISVHDSADDESELSDVGDEGAEEDVKEEDLQAKAPMFPNLFGVNRNGSGGDSTAEPNLVPSTADGAEREPKTREASAETEA